MSEQTLLFLDANEVRQALPMKTAVELMRKAFTRLSLGEAMVPTRIHIESPESQGNTLVMPSCLPSANQLGVKVISVFANNAQIGLPRIQALMLLLDGKTGRPVSIMDGAALTALRTGAASGAATDLLAKASAETVAIFGAGVQGRTQLEAVCAVRTIRQVWVVDPTEEAVEDFCWEMHRALRIPVEAAKNAREAMKHADIICAASTSKLPVFADSEVRAGQHINAVGSYQPTVQEIPAKTVLRSKVVVDHRASALAETGDLIIPIQQALMDENHIHAELGEIASGEKPGRTSPEEVTLFKSVGVAVQDLVAASHIYEEAQQFSLGSEVAF